MAHTPSPPPLPQKAGGKGEVLRLAPTAAAQYDDAFAHVRHRLGAVRSVRLMVDVCQLEARLVGRQAPVPPRPPPHRRPPRVPPKVLDQKEGVKKQGHGGEPELGHIPDQRGPRPELHAPRRLLGKRKHAAGRVTEDRPDRPPVRTLPPHVVDGLGDVLEEAGHDLGARGAAEEGAPRQVPGGGGNERGGKRHPRRDEADGDARADSWGGVAAGSNAGPPVVEALGGDEGAQGGAMHGKDAVVPLDMTRDVGVLGTQKEGATGVECIGGKARQVERRPVKGDALHRAGAEDEDDLRVAADGPGTRVYPAANSSHKGEGIDHCRDGDGGECLGIPRHSAAQLRPAGKNRGRRGCGG
ncbi:hypothetical protein BU14_0058s0055 [Porphyra umbilicalis]|uniref:Uncharacterized protein n=1 Tax=Porphyra umbilicalis TaxID=2786 RepID=A0A1X6PGZ8_PORUM|nr:hypothetical protein BU14_0058s0055 [Porphyra umbilicalis]|eukprot:OSX80144.1 hypothetical protein BU14_0058s0055 [Porphyra umbilicalis]